jgi:hypothetical protein
VLFVNTGQQRSALKKRLACRRNPTIIMLRGQAQQRREVTLKIVLFAMISAQGRAVSLIAQTMIMGTLINTGMIIRMTMITGMITVIVIIPIRMQNIPMALNQSVNI